MPPETTPGCTFAAAPRPRVPLYRGPRAGSGSVSWEAGLCQAIPWWQATLPLLPEGTGLSSSGSWRPHAALGVTTGPSLPAPLAIQMEPLPCLPRGQSAPHPRPSLEARGHSVGSPPLASQTLGRKPGAHFPTPGRLKSGPHLITSWATTS